MRIAANNFLGELQAQRITDQDVVQAFAVHTYFFGEPNLSAKTLKTKDLYKRTQSTRRVLIPPGPFLARFETPSRHLKAQRFLPEPPPAWLGEFHCQFVAGCHFLDDKDRPDYTVFTGEWEVGRIYETRGGPDNLRWFWSMNVKRPHDTIGPGGDPRRGQGAVSEELGRVEGVGGDGRDWLDFCCALGCFRPALDTSSTFAARAFSPLSNSGLAAGRTAGRTRPGGFPFCPHFANIKLTRIFSPRLRHIKAL